MALELGVERSNIDTKCLGSLTATATLGSLSKENSMPDLLCSDSSTNGSDLTKSGNVSTSQSIHQQTKPESDSSLPVGESESPSPAPRRPTTPVSRPQLESPVGGRRRPPGREENNFNESVTDLHRNTAIAIFSASAQNLTMDFMGHGDLSGVPEAPPPPPPAASAADLDDVLHMSDSENDSDGDSTIEGSWRPAPDKRRILAETMEAAENGMIAPLATSREGDMPLSSKDNLDVLLDKIIQDGKEKTYLRSSSPGVNYRKRVQHRQKGSAQSVASAPEYSRAALNMLAQIPGGANGTAGAQSPFLATVSSQQPPRSNSTPIAWSRKETQRGGRRPLTRTNSSRSSASMSSEPPRSPANDVLSRFLDRESARTRPTSAHTVSGDPRANPENDAVSIAISAGGGAKTFKVGPQEARMIQEILEASQRFETSPLKDSSASKLSLPSPSRHDTVHTMESTIADSEHISSRSSMRPELSPGSGTGKEDLSTYLRRRRGQQGKVSSRSVPGRIRNLSDPQVFTQPRAEAQGKRPSTEEDRYRHPSQSRSGACHPRSNSDINPDYATAEVKPRSFSSRDSRDLSASAKGPLSVNELSIFTPDQTNSPRRAPTSAPARQSVSPQGTRLQSLRLLDGRARDTRPLSNGRPTNRRTMMRKMQSVPVLPSEDLYTPLVVESLPEENVKRERRASSSPRGRARSSSKGPGKSDRKSKERKPSPSASKPSSLRSLRKSASQRSLGGSGNRSQSVTGNRERSNSADGKMKLVRTGSLRRGRRGSNGAALSCDKSVSKKEAQMTMKSGGSPESSSKRPPVSEVGVEGFDAGLSERSEGTKTKKKSLPGSVTKTPSSSRPVFNKALSTTNISDTPRQLNLSSPTTETIAEAKESKPKTLKPKKSGSKTEKKTKKKSTTTPKKKKSATKEVPTSGLEMPEPCVDSPKDQKSGKTSKSSETDEVTEKSTPTDILPRPSAPISPEEVAEKVTSLNPPSAPVRKLSRPPTPETRSKSRPMRLPPVAVAEGSVLEVSDDISVCSDITDGFSLEPSEPEVPSKKNRRHELGVIDESKEISATQHTENSWAVLSTTGGTTESSAARNRQLHLSRRWESSPNLVSNQDSLQTPPARVAHGDSPQATPKSLASGGGRLTKWMKKMPFGRKSKGDDSEK